MHNKMRAAAVGVALLLVTGCGKEEILDPLVSYMVGEEEITALDTLLAEGGLTAVETGEEEGTQPLYVYSDLSETGPMVEQYVQRLTDTETGFMLCDSEGNETEERPDFAQEEGEVILHRETETEDTYVELVIHWTEDTCSVQTGVVEVEREEEEGKTMQEIAEYFAACRPADLGLEGESMAEYEIYPLDAMVHVDGVECFRVSIYDREEGIETNEICGIYLLSGDMGHLYRLDPETETVTLLRK